MEGRFPQCPILINGMNFCTLLIIPSDIINPHNRESLSLSNLPQSIGLKGGAVLSLGLLHQMVKISIHFSQCDDPLELFAVIDDSSL